MSLLSNLIRQSGIVDGLERLGPLPSRRRLLTAGGVLGSLLAGGKARAEDLPFSPTRWLVGRITQGLTEFENNLATSLGYSGYLEYHLNHTAINDAAVSNFVNLYPTINYQPWQLAQLAQPSQVVRELQISTIYRAVFSKRQLFERMVEFWCDHFNIDITKSYCPWVGTVLNREAIRPNALGTFPALLAAVAHDPSMLMSLDNDTSISGEQNENYARELLELHSLGVNGGYTQQDVREVARCFTGWTKYDYTVPNQGLSFRFDASKHDNGQKTVLGQVIPAGGGQADAEAVLAIVASHPSTAQFIATKMCKWFYSYNPPAALVNAVASTYMSTGGNIKDMLRTLFNTCDPAAAQPKLKRPFHVMVSMLRATGAQVADPEPLLAHFAQSGQMPHTWGPPDGFPDKLNHWAGLLLPRWNFAINLLTNAIQHTTTNTATLFAGATTSDGAMNRLDSLCYGGAMPSSEKNRIKQYMLPDPPSELRMREAAALVLSSPSFQWY